MQRLSELDLPRLPMEDPRFAEDPWPYLAEARERHPWLATCAFGHVVHEYQAIRDLLWLDHSMRGAYESIVEVLGAQGTNWGDFEERMINARTGEDHMRLRKLLAPAFTPQQAERHRALMSRVIGKLLDEWVPKGAFDFEEFASWFPITVMCSLIGAPTSALPGLRASLEAFGLCMSMDPNHLPALIDAMAVLDRFMQDLVAERRRTGNPPGEKDLLAVLLETEESGALSERELYDLLIFMFVAGYDTSKNALTILMSILIERPEMYARCGEDLGWCGKVVEEGFRYLTTSTIPRLTTRDIAYRGVTIPEGTMLFFPVSISGREEDVFVDAGGFDPDRPNNRRHLAFGMGAHICLGQFIARAQIQEALHQIARRMKNPVRTGPSGWRPFYGVWGLKGLPIAFEQARETESVG